MRSLSLSLAAACLFLAPSLASAYTPITHSELQSLYYDGSAYKNVFEAEHPKYPPGTMYPVQLIGVVVNNPGDMLDYSLSSTLSSGPQWQTFIQALPAGTYGGYTVNSGDFGGTALYMMQKSFKGEAQHYSDTEWINTDGTSEMERLNNPYLINSTTQVSLKTGDVVLVQADAPGMGYNGKYNINERHMKSSAYNFKITVLEEGVTPTATDITLADLKNSSDNFIFDTTMDSENVLTRSGGCERYQGSLVHLDNLTIADADNWKPYAPTTPIKVQQTGNDGIVRSFNMILGYNSDSSYWSSIDAAALETTPFSVTAILDQEDTSGTEMTGYRLWLTSTDNISVVPEPNVFVMLVAGLFSLAAYAWRKRRQ